MTDHEEQIKSIINLMLDYDGGYYPNVKKLAGVNEALPKFLVDSAVPVLETGTMYGESFKVYFKASSRTELQTIKEKLLGMSTSASSGYNTPITILINLVSEHNNNHGTMSVDQLSNPVTLQSTSYVGANTALAGSSPTSVIFLRFPFSYKITSIFSVDSAILTFMSATGEAGIDMTIYGIDQEDIGEYPADLTTFDLTTSSSNVDRAWEHIVNYDWDVTTIIDELITSYELDDLCLLIGENETDANTFLISTASFSGYDDPYLTITLSPNSNAPFWIDVRDVKPEYNGNDFYLECTIEARWSI